MKKLTLLLLAAALAACGQKVTVPPVDAGPQEDAGVDAGVDAGRPRGVELPTGYSTALELPNGNGPSVRVGVSAAMALDQFGHPMFAAIYTDPNNDGVRIDDTVVFTRWNGADKLADGGTVGWQPQATIAIIGEIDTAAPLRQVSISRDGTTGTIGIAFVTEQKSVRLAVSNDEGATWSLETASLANPSSHLLSNPALVLAGGEVHLAYFEDQASCGTADCGQVVYRKRVGKAAFTDAKNPPPAGTDVALARPIALAVDSSGAAGITYFVGPTGAATGPLSLLFWRPSGTTTQKIADSGGPTTNKTASVSLTFSGVMARVAYHLPSVAAPDTQLWYAAASDAAGTSFTPVAIPRNGITGTLEGTHSYQAIALDPGGKIALAANFAQTPFSSQCTGGPKVSRSDTGTSFTTCRADTGATPVFGFAGLWINAAFHKADKLTLGFTYETNSNPSVKGGVIVFRQP